jgi:hypothetical protein
MSSLRTTASAARLLRSATHARTAVLPATRRCKSSSSTDSSTSVPTKTEQQKREMSPMATLPRNSPDYNVPIDLATSYVPDEATPPSLSIAYSYLTSALQITPPSPPCRRMSKTAARRTCSRPA